MLASRNVRCGANTTGGTTPRTFLRNAWLSFVFSSHMSGLSDSRGEGIWEQSSLISCLLIQIRRCSTTSPYMRYFIMLNDCNQPPLAVSKMLRALTANLSTRPWRPFIRLEQRRFSRLCRTAIPVDRMRSTPVMLGQYDASRQIPTTALRGGNSRDRRPAQRGWVDPLGSGTELEIEVREPGTRHRRR